MQKCELPFRDDHVAAYLACSNHGRNAGNGFDITMLDLNTSLVGIFRTDFRPPPPVCSLCRSEYSNPDISPY